MENFSIKLFKGISSKGNEYFKISLDTILGGTTIKTNGLLWKDDAILLSNKLNIPIYELKAKQIK